MDNFASAKLVSRIQVFTVLMLVEILLVACATTIADPTSIPRTVIPDQPTQTQLTTPSSSLKDGSGLHHFEDSPCGRMNFENWSEWTKVNPKPLNSEGHGEKWVDVYVDDLAESIYGSASAPYPECAKIVKPEFTDASRTDILRLGVMVKMPPGYDPENGDWWYAAYNSLGTKAQLKGKIDFCIACHKEAAETDYLFSEDVMEAVQE
jgi:hypothetical protein